MATTPKRVLSVELNPDLADLVQEILVFAGDDVSVQLCDALTLDTVLALNPDVILLDLGFKSTPCGWTLLAALRSHVDTQGIPVMVISDSDELLAEAKRNFNVRQELIKPYDLEDLLRGLEAAVKGIPLLPHPAPPATQGALSVQAADVIGHDTDTLMVEWVHRVRQAKVFGQEMKVPTRLLIDDVTVWLMMLISALRYGPEDTIGRPEIRAKVLKHVQEAKQHGLTLAQIAKQFEVLRDVVWSALERADMEQLTVHDVFALGRVVNTAVDDVIVQVAAVYTSDFALSA